MTTNDPSHEKRNTKEREREPRSNNHSEDLTPTGINVNNRSQGRYRLLCLAERCDTSVPTLSAHTVWGGSDHWRINRLDGDTSPYEALKNIVESVRTERVCVDTVLLRTHHSVLEPQTARWTSSNSARNGRTSPVRSSEEHRRDR